MESGLTAYPGFEGGAEAGGGGFAGGAGLFFGGLSSIVVGINHGPGLKVSAPLQALPLT